MAIENSLCAAISNPRSQVSDHGEGLGEHDTVGHGYIHGEQLHVPLMMRIPGVSPRRVSRLISLTDVFPTYLGLIDAKGWDPFLKQASGRNVLARRGSRSSVLSTRTARERAGLLGPAFALSLENWKLVWEPERNDRLFDLGSDPFELTNRIESNRRRADKLLKELIERRDAYASRARELGSDDREDGVEMDPELLERLRALGYVN